MPLIKDVGVDERDLPRYDFSVMSFEDPSNGVKQGFRDQLITWLSKNSPALLERARAQEASERLPLAKLLEQRYGIRNIQIEREAPYLYRLPVKSHFSEKRLPQGYAYEGSAARALLLRALGLDTHAVPRDVDLVRFASSCEKPVNAQLAEQDATVLAEFGEVDQDRIDHFTNVQEYFSTRDFTLNEVYATDNIIVASLACVIDTVRHVIRITSYEREHASEQKFSKLFAKMLRLLVEMEHRWGKGNVQTAGVDRKDVGEQDPFYLALQFDKANQQSLQYAEDYLKKLREAKQIPQNVKTVEDGFAYFTFHLLYRNFIFRSEPPETTHD